MGLMPINLTTGHIVYKDKDGKRAPSVTTFLGLLAKPALYRWHNTQGLAGIDTQKFVAKQADIGTLTHSRVQAHLLGFDGIVEDGLSPEFVAKSLYGFERFMDWYQCEGLTFEASELRMVSETWGSPVGGTLDILSRRDSKRVLVDLKTSDSGIWPEMLMQASAYAAMVSGPHLEINGDGKTFGPADARPVDEVVIVRVGKEKEDVFDTRVLSRDERERHAEAFGALVRLRPLLDAAGMLR